MKRLEQKKNNTVMRKRRIRAVIYGTASRPRLSVFISNNHISAQIIDDTAGKTLVAVTTVGQKEANGSMTEKAVWAGQSIAIKAQKAKIKQIVFDRNGRLYHGRIKALAEAARKEGLEF